MNDADLSKFIRESNAIEGEFDLGDPPEWKSGKLWPNDVEAAQKFLNTPLTSKSLKKLHMTLAESRGYDISHPGEYRRGNEWLFSPKGCAAPGMVEHLMNNYFLDLDKFSSWEAHCRYEKTHPFEDLNGRTGRLIWLHKVIESDNEYYAVKYGFKQLFYYETLSQFSL